MHTVCLLACFCFLFSCLFFYLDLTLLWYRAYSLPCSPHWSSHLDSSLNQLIPSCFFSFIEIPATYTAKILPFLFNKPKSKSNFYLPCLPPEPRKWFCLKAPCVWHLPHFPRLGDQLTPHYANWFSLLWEQFFFHQRS